MKTVLYIKSTGSYQDRRKLSGALDYARQRGWNLQSVGMPRTEAQARELVHIWKPDGIIANRGIHFDIDEFKAFAGIPTVSFHQPDTSRVPRENCVLCDSRTAAEIAAREMLLSGVDHFAFVPWPTPLGWSRIRERTFKEVLALHDRSVSVFNGGTVRLGTARHHRALATWLSALPKPLGVFAANDLTAVSVMAACALAGLAVPTEVAVIGVDNDLELCEGTTPALSSVDFDFPAAGRLAAETVDRLIEGTLHTPVQVLYPPTRAIRRASTRRLERKDAAVLDAVEQIRREACQGLSAKDVIAQFPCSRRMADIRFRKVVGHSILEEIRAVRLETAQNLLADSPSDIAFIANRCGYSSLAAFSTFFRQETGLPPSQWVCHLPSKTFSSAAQVRYQNKNTRFMSPPH